MSGLIDVSDLLLDPDFVQSMVLIKRTTSVNSFGENVLVEAPEPVVGSAQPLSGKDLERLPEALRQRNVRSFWIKAEVVTDGSGVYLDLVEFQGKRYQVLSSKPWLNWGAGWNEVIAVEESLS